MMMGMLTEVQLVMGISLTVAALILTWATWGIAIPVIIFIGLLYMGFGHLLPGPLHHPRFSAEYTISLLGMSTQSGVFGSLTKVSGNMVVYVLAFGAVMQSMGPVPAFVEIGKAIARVIPGGPAYVAWFASAMVGMVCGQGTANVAITGPFTIGAMKKHGYSGEAAGAIEACSCVGGQIMPPVMASASFIMAGFLGVSYFFIISKAIFGAIVYYFGLFLGILIYSGSMGIKRSTEAVNTRMLWRRIPIFIIPLTVAIVMLFTGYSIALCFTIALFIAIFVGLVVLPENRSFKILKESSWESTKLVAMVGLILMVAGMLETVATETGLGTKMTSAITDLSGGYLIPTLFLCAIVSVFLGLGFPGPAAYTIVALVMIPTLLEMGVDKVAAHFFCFYFSVFAAISPPTAPAAMVAASLAKASFWPIGWLSMKLLAVPFIFVPFVFVYYPQVLDFPGVFTLETLYILAIVMLGIVMLNAGWFGWLLARTTKITRSAAVLCFVSIMFGLLGKGTAIPIVAIPAALILAALVFVIQIKKSRKKESLLQTS